MTLYYQKWTYGTSIPEGYRLLVIGLDEFNRRHLESLPEAEGFQIKEALSHESLKEYSNRSIDSLLEETRERLNNRKIDALVTWWDFPGTTGLKPGN